MTTPTRPKSPRAAQALTLVESVQRALADALGAERFSPVSWLRDGGRHGGGTRLVGDDTFDRASINVSQVHYDDLPHKRLSSATALSTIVHPEAPLAPSMHMHVSWTEMRDGSGYWRVMADLNPSNPDDGFRDRFTAALRAAAGPVYDAAAAQGDRYFRIPALDRHRGVAHFYLEQYSTDDPASDEALARAVAHAVIDVYPPLVREGSARPADASHADRQRAYHTLYLFQVLTLDRGTTSGLLIHDQNDVGIMGSLPSAVDTRLLRQWRARMPAPQDQLLDALVEVLERGGEPGIMPVDVRAKVGMAHAMRAHYRAHPEALALQASGDVVPPTVANHR